MSILLFSVGAIAALAGIVMAGFGIPVSEFSFGNTLINAGATTAAGGLIVIGLGAVVSKLQHIVDALSAPAPIRPSRPVETYEAAPAPRAVPAAGRAPFPPKPKPEIGTREQQPPESRAVAPPLGRVPMDDQPAQSFVPKLPNPDEPPVTVEDEISLSPQHPMAASAAANGDEADTDDTRHPPMLDAGWRAPPSPIAPQSGQGQTRQQSSYFDAMWPAEIKPAKSPAISEAKANLDLPLSESPAAPSSVAEPETTMPTASEPREVAILKSGIVDGMGYTLYVDGSIEAELPQGTLRFASINELRRHLEKSS
jgi:hypothetical protein